MAKQLATSVASVKESTYSVPSLYVCGPVKLYLLSLKCRGMGPHLQHFALSLQKRTLDKSNLWYTESKAKFTQALQMQAHPVLAWILQGQCKQLYLNPSKEVLTVFLLRQCCHKVTTDLSTELHQMKVSRSTHSTYLFRPTLSTLTFRSPTLEPDSQ